VLLLAARLFSLTGIWASEASSELILCIVAMIMLKRFQGKADAQSQHQQAQRASATPHPNPERADPRASSD
jgi:hypothetical protein